MNQDKLKHKFYRTIRDFGMDPEHISLLELIKCVYEHAYQEGYEDAEQMAIVQGAANRGKE